MHRAIPVTSKVLEEKWNRLQHERLQQRISTTRGSLFSAQGSRAISTPGSPNPLSPIRVIINRAKRDQMVEDRYTEIEKENRRLLEKMTGMLKSRKKNSIIGGVPNYMTRQNYDAANLTSEQIQQIFTQNQQMSPRSNSPVQLVNSVKKSLNREHRRRELQRISEENSAFLNRLQTTQPLIKAQKLEEDYRKKIPKMMNLCELPYVLNSHYSVSKRNSPTPNFLSSSSTQSGEQGPFSYKSISLNHYTQVPVVQQWSQTSQNKAQTTQSFDSNGKSLLGSFVAKNPPINNVGMFDRPSVANTIKNPNALLHREADRLDQNRVVHFKKGKYITSGYFVVEISTNTAALFIAAFDVESPASFLINIPFPKAQNIIEMFGRNFDLMSEYLSFSKNKLVILNPAKTQQRKQQEYNQALSNFASGSGMPGNYGKRAQTTAFQTAQIKSGSNQMVAESMQRAAPWSQREKRIPQTFEGNYPQVNGSPVGMIEVTDGSYEEDDLIPKKDRDSMNKGISQEEAPIFRKSHNHQNKERNFEECEVVNTE